MESNEVKETKKILIFFPFSNDTGTLVSVSVLNA